MYGPYYPFHADPSSVPRSHYYPTSDGSDSGSPGGGGGGNAPSGSAYSSQSSAQHSHNRGYSHEIHQEDSPYSPSRSSLPQAPPASTRDFVLPPEHQLSGTLHGATPAFSGESQHSGTLGQYQPQHSGTQHGQTLSSPCYVQPHAGFVTLPVSSYPEPMHRPQHHRESSTASLQPSYSPPTVAPNALQTQAVPQYPDAGDYLRHQLGLQPGSPISLDSLPDPPQGLRPSQAIPILIKLAIYGSPHKRLTLKGIYDAIENRFEYFRTESSGAWRRSIRHNLSLNKVFRSVPRPITEPGKGSYWELDISQGEGYKRERKRRKKATSSRLAQHDSDLESPSGDDDEESEVSPPSRSQSPIQRAGATEAGSVGPLRSALAPPSARRSSPYPGGDIPVRGGTSSRSQTVEAARATSPAWGGDIRGLSHAGVQNPQGYYHQPQTYRVPPQPLPITTGTESFQSMFSSTPFAHTMAWHAQQHMGQQQVPRPASVSSQISHTSSMSSSASVTSGSHAQLGHFPATQISAASAGIMQGGMVQYPGFSQPGQETSEGSNEYESQGTQHDNRRYRG